MTLAALTSILVINLLAAMSPGPGFVLCVRTAAAEGFRTAALVALGMGIVSGLWATAALLGLSLLFQLAPAALTLLKVGGGLFLLWIALQTFRHAADPLPEPGTALPRAGLSALRLGLVTQLSNPKTATFFGAVFLGLVPPDTTPAALALLIAAIALMETAWFMLVGRVFSLARPRRAYGRAKTTIDRAFGGLIAAFGLKIAAT